MNDCAVGDANAVIDFVFFLQATQNGNGIFHCGLLHLYFLEAPFEGRIFFDVLAVLVQGGGADGVEFASGEHGLQEIARVHGPFALSGADDVVNFVDKHDDFAFGALHFV